MSLSHCPACQRLCFVASTSCPSCGAPFRPGELRMAASAEEKSFMRRSRTLFLVPLTGVLVVLALVLTQI